MEEDLKTYIRELETDETSLEKNLNELVFSPDENAEIEGQLHQISATIERLKSILTKGVK